jgi:hypothetical protein
MVIFKFFYIIDEIIENSLIFLKTYKIQNPLSFFSIKELNNLKGKIFK